MKTLIFGFAMMVATFTACNNNDDQTKETTNVGDTTATNTAASNAEVKTASANEMVTAYLQLKNALAKDNDKEAAAAGKQITDAMQKTDEASMTAEQKKVYGEVKEDIKEHAEHVSNNAGKIEHQREHFDMISKDMYDMVKVFKPTQTLYVDHCPMYNDNKGATWLSEVKEIKNPYLGKKMPTCGSVKEEIK